MAIAFFDLDKTLLAVNSGSLWLRSEYRRGMITKRMVLRATLWIARYHLGTVNLESAVLEAMSTLQGDAEADLRARTNHFYARDIARTYRPGGLDAVRHHRARGDRVVMLTSTTQYLAEAVHQDVPMDALLCNRVEVVNGVFTGKPSGPLCFGTGKLLHAREYAQAHGEDLADASFYTDSMSDVSVLEHVGRPVIVHPDPRLKRHATKRGWPIVDWGKQGVSAL